MKGGRWHPEGRYTRHRVPELREVSDPHAHAPWESGLPAESPPPVVDRRELAPERFSHVRKKAVWT